MAALYFRDGGVHALRGEALQLWMHGAVIFGDDVPCRLRSPSRSSHLLVEQVDGWRTLCRPDELLLLVGKVSAEGLRAARAQPDASVRHFNVLEDLCRGELALMTLCRLVVIRSEGGDVHQT